MRLRTDARRYAVGQCPLPAIEIGVGNAEPISHAGCQRQILRCPERSILKYPVVIWVGTCRGNEVLRQSATW